MNTLLTVTDSDSTTLKAEQDCATAVGVYGGLDVGSTGDITVSGTTVGFRVEGESQIPKVCRFWGNLQTLQNSADLHATLNWTVIRAQDELGVHI